MKIPAEHPTALIYHRNPISRSETFVLDQASWLRRFDPYYAGGEQTGRPPLPEDRREIQVGESFLGPTTGRPAKVKGFTLDFPARLQHIAPSLVHAHFEASGIAALPFTRELHIPLITTFYGDDGAAAYGQRRTFGHLNGGQRRKLQREGTLFVAASEFIRGRLIECGYPQERIATVPIGVDVDFFKPQREETESPLVLFIGPLAEKEGIAYLLDAWAEVTKAHKDARLLLVGDGPLFRELFDRILALRLSRAMLTCARGPEGIRDLMGKASLLVVPSVTSASGACGGIPMVVAEAQAMGLPVVGTYHGGIPEIVKNGQTGLLVPEKSIHQLAQNILLLLAKPGLRREMGLAARENVHLNFNLRFQTAKLENYFLMALREHAKKENGR
jgi:glycosyltransferase involved in cell wall biosynthesis